MSSKKGSYKPSSNRDGGIQILNDGPCYICYGCQALLVVPDRCLERRVSTDRDGQAIDVDYYICPKCNDENVLVDESDYSDYSSSESEEDSRSRGEDTRRRKRD